MAVSPSHPISPPESAAVSHAAAVSEPPLAAEGSTGEKAIGRRRSSRQRSKKRKPAQDPPPAKPATSSSKSKPAASSKSAAASSKSSGSRKKSTKESSSVATPPPPPGEVATPPLSSSAQKIDQVHKELAAKRIADLAKLQEVNADLQSQTVSLKAELKEAKTVAETTSKKLVKAEKELKKLEVEQEVYTDLEEAEAEVKMLKAKFAAAQKQADQGLVFERKLVAAEQELSVKNAANTGYRATNANLNRDIKTLRSELSRVRKENSVLSKTVAEFDKAKETRLALETKLETKKLDLRMQQLKEKGRRDASTDKSNLAVQEATLKARVQENNVNLSISAKDAEAERKFRMEEKKVTAKSKRFTNAVSMNGGGPVSGSGSGAIMSNFASHLSSQQQQQYNTSANFGATSGIFGNVARQAVAGLQQQQGIDRFSQDPQLIGAAGMAFGERANQMMGGGGQQFGGQQFGDGGQQFGAGGQHFGTGGQLHFGGQQQQQYGGVQQHQRFGGGEQLQQFGGGQHLQQFGGGQQLQQFGGGQQLQQFGQQFGGGQQLQQFGGGQQLQTGREIAVRAPAELSATLEEEAAAQEQETAAQEQETAPPDDNDTVSVNSVGENSYECEESGY